MDVEAHGAVINCRHCVTWRFLEFNSFCITGATPIETKESKNVTTEINETWDFPSGQVAKILCFHCRGCRFNSLQGS